MTTHSETKPRLAAVLWQGDPDIRARSALNRSELAQEIAAELPGWDKLAESAYRLEDATFVRRQVDRNVLAAKILDGADPMKMAREVAHAEGNQAQEIAFVDLINIATKRLALETYHWLDGHRSQLTGIVLERLRGIVEQTKALPAQYSDEQRHELASQWDALRRVHRIFTNVLSKPGQLPHVELFDNYAEVWPAAFTFETIEGAGIYELGQAMLTAARAPWQDEEGNEPNTVTLLRYIADHNVALWLPTSEQDVDTKQQQLEQTAREAARALEANRRAMKGRVQL